MDTYNGIPYSYNQVKQKMKLAIHKLSDWDTLHNKGYYNDLKQSAYDLAVKCLIEMASESNNQIYNKTQVSYVEVIDEINDHIKQQSVKSLLCVIEQAIDDYIISANKKDIPFPQAYMKSCIWNSFKSCEIKYQVMFNRTYYQN